MSASVPDRRDCDHAAGVHSRLAQMLPKQLWLARGRAPLRSPLSSLPESAGDASVLPGEQHRSPATSALPLPPSPAGTSAPGRLVSGGKVVLARVLRAASHGGLRGPGCPPQAGERWSGSASAGGRRLEPSPAAEAGPDAERYPYLGGARFSRRSHAGVPWPHTPW